MEIISIINQKGGVGKSTTAHAIGTGLQLRGFKVLFIDLDPQGNLSYTLDVKTNTKNIMNVLVSPNLILENIQDTNIGDIVSSSNALVGADATLTSVGKEYRLKEALEFLENSNKKYDYCIIDTPPSLGILTVNSLTVSKGIIIPSQADIFSFQGIKQLKETIDTIKKYCNNELYIMGIVITRFSSRSIISREMEEMLIELSEELNTKVYNSKIRECIAIKEAQATREPIFTYAPKSNATADYSGLLDEIISEAV